MDFIVKNGNVSVAELSRQIGYVIIDTMENNEYNMVRRLDISNYPRFHAYVKQRGVSYIFNLHLDQKEPSYKGTHAHAGEYEGPVVETEADRIKEILQ